jgi:hypothetical protein
MQILSNSLYILIEGEPNSPEVAFINRVIGRLISEAVLPTINYEVVEVGGSGNFNSIAQIIYRKSSLHKTTPVLAISDKDFRTQESVNTQNPKTDNQLVKDKAARIIYWERHEWENFILEETGTIASILNQIPTQAKNHKPIRKNTTNTLSKEQLDAWLLQYFQNSLVEELVECLRFRFREKVNPRFKLEKLRTEELATLSLQDLEIWFRNQVASTAREYRKNLRNQKSMLTEKVNEMLWSSWLNDPSTLDFNQAKTFFQGKEALRELFCKAVNHLSIQNLDYETFVQQIILPELEKNVNASIIQQIRLMLTPYFQNVANSQRERTSGRGL